MIEVLGWFVAFIVIAAAGVLIAWLGPPDDLYDVYSKEAENEQHH